MIFKDCAIFLLLILILFVSCESSKNSNQLIDITSYNNGAWVDDDTFRIAAEGPPPRAIKDARERRKSALRSAKRHAQYKVLNIFKEISNKSGLKKNKTRYERRKLAKNVIRIIKNGYILKDSVFYDKTDRCRIIYEVKAKGLKQILYYADLVHVEVIQ